MKNFLQIGLIVSAGVLASVTSTFASPMLRSMVTVNSPIVTVGDMFEGADLLAEQALFRAPQPGTSGNVSIEAIQVAAAKIGLTQFVNPGVLSVKVARSGTLVAQNLIEDLIRDDLSRRGIITVGISAEFTLTGGFPEIYADQQAAPATLLNLQYTQGSGEFSARFAVAGKPAPLETKGRLELYVEMPHLIASLPSGKVITADDVEMRPVQLRFAQASGMPELDQVIGKQLRRPARAGMMVRPSDLMAPQLIARNDAVIVYFRNGPLTLTVKGQALNAAAYGETVSVLNTLSNKVINGFAVEAGAVQMGERPLSNASL